jgi:membrane-bound lytic murein transglycosylase B
MLTLYQRAALTCPGLSWSVLAAIGTVESSNGTSELPGVHSGANYAGAEGPMQFEPPTFRAYDEPVPTGGADPPSPYDPTDAAYAAARLLCANGGANGADIPGAVYAYNHSRSYVSEVLSLAASYQ